MIEFWKVHLENPPVLTLLSQDAQSIKTEFEKIKILIDSKSKNPIQPFPINELRTFEALITALNSKLTDFNSHITAYNSRITVLKASTSPNIVQLESDLKKLTAIKKRNDSAIVALCTAHTAQSTATSAQGTASSAASTASGAQSTATTALGAAITAQDTATASFIQANAAFIKANTGTGNASFADYFPTGDWGNLTDAASSAFGEDLTVMYDCRVDPITPRGYLLSKDFGYVA